jgi:hypothetical protein
VGILPSGNTDQSARILGKTARFFLVLVVMNLDPQVALA